MRHKNSISVLGCGWLGFPLAKSLLKKGYSLKGSTTSNDKISILFAEGIVPFLVQFPDCCNAATLADFLKSNILIISVPPGRNSVKQESYFGLLNSLTAELPNSSIQKIVFVSSTSVYGDINGSVNESDTPVPDTDAGKRMLIAEQMILETPIKHVIVRLSGLIGPGRHPGKFLSGKTGVSNGLAPVNLIHLKDAIGIIQLLALNESASGVYNGVTPDHPTRQEFYTQASKVLDLDAPQFIPGDSSWKKIESIRIGRELEYKFQVPDLLECLSDPTIL